MRISAVIAVGALAPQGDPQAIAELTRAYRNEDREVVWNASLALARLGSATSVPMLQDMLTRKYWDGITMDLPTLPGDAPRPLSAHIRNEYLKVTIDAAAELGDPRLKPAVEALANDPVLQVKDHAHKALERWMGKAD
jgi:HEAT repeat protein